MKSRAQVVVIGGGVVGCSVLYHLTRFGWHDVVLLERAELTAGSTWHAAGGMHTINADPTIAKLQQYTVELYREIESASGQDVGLHLTGGVMLAATEARFDWLKSMAAKGRCHGLETEIISACEAHERMPLLDPDQFVGALYDEVEGHLDPYGTTHAYARCAKQNGAVIELHTRVVDLRQRTDGHWDVVTDQGTIVAEHVVNAAGLWAREVGRMVGLELPVLAMEHMYLMTDDMPEVAEFNARTGLEMLHAVDFDGELYLRQEGGGMLMGTYERNGRPWSPVETPWDFGQDLLPPDLDRITDELSNGFRHFPAFENAGIRRIVNGPFTFAPDGNPLVGPVRGLPGFWCACAVMAGFSQGGGVGLALANWMIDGDPGLDVFAMDVARFGDYATREYTHARVTENYSRRFSIRFPNEELPAARPLETTPVHDRLAALGARFGAVAGLEVPLWFAPATVGDDFDWRRSTDFPFIEAEVRAVRERVGVIDVSGFATYRVRGPGASAWLDHLLAGRLPSPGRLALAPMLNARGRVVGDFTVSNLAGVDGRAFGQERLKPPHRARAAPSTTDDDWLLVGAGVAETFHLRWFEQHLPDDGSVDVEPLRGRLVGLAIAGPRARSLLSAVTSADVSGETFPPLTVRTLDLGMATVVAIRVSYSGGLGFEFWMRPAVQCYVFDRLMHAGAPLGLMPFGARALDSLRLEKGFGSWRREYRPVYTPEECGLDRFVAYDKPTAFVGQVAAVARREAGGDQRLVSFVVDAIDADALGDEPIFHDGRVCGQVTSGGFAHGAGVSVALGYVPRALASCRDRWEIELLGQRLTARRLAAPLFDPDGSAARG